jgi:predicted nucleotidyltransferase
MPALESLVGLDETRMTETIPLAAAPDPLTGRPDAAALRATVAAVVDAVHPLAIVLFGSRARGDHRPTSDVDLLVVVPEGLTTRAVCAALDARRALADTPLAVDVLAATPGRLVAARGDYSSVLHWAQEQGVVLYRADDGAAAQADTVAEAVGSRERHSWLNVHLLKSTEAGKGAA